MVVGARITDIRHAQLRDRFHLGASRGQSPAALKMDLAVANQKVVHPGRRGAGNADHAVRTALARISTMTMKVPTTSRKIRSTGGVIQRQNHGHSSTAPMARSGRPPSPDAHDGVANSAGDAVRGAPGG